MLHLQQSEEYGEGWEIVLHLQQLNRKPIKDGSGSRNEQQAADLKRGRGLILILFISRYVYIYVYSGVILLSYISVRVCIIYVRLIYD